MAFDYKKEYKEYYLPPKKPVIITIPPMNFIAVKGKGDPNEVDGEYQKAMNILYGVAYTLKMSYKGSYRMEGFFEYVVPPLEGLWFNDGYKDFHYTDKSSLNWLSLIRLPEFVTQNDFNWAVKTAEEKKKTDFSKAEFFTYNEGLCVQCMHIGSYDDEPATIESMYDYAEKADYEIDLSPARLHHEIYLSDPRKAAADKLKTVLRYPIKHK